MRKAKKQSEAVQRPRSVGQLKASTKRPRTKDACHRFGTARELKRVKRLAEAHSLEAAKELVRIMRSKSSPAGVALAAANAILTIALGEPEAGDTPDSD